MEEYIADKDDSRMTMKMLALVRILVFMFAISIPRGFLKIH